MIGIRGGVAVGCSRFVLRVLECLTRLGKQKITKENPKRIFVAFLDFGGFREDFGGYRFCYLG